MPKLTTSSMPLISSVTWLATPPSSLWVRWASGTMSRLW